MDSDADEALSHINNFLSPNDLPNRIGCRNAIPNCEGMCVGDNVCSIGDKVVRVVAFQAAGGIGDVDDLVKSAVSRLRSTGVHVGIYTETKVLTADHHIRIINAFNKKWFPGAQPQCGPQGGG